MKRQSGLSMVELLISTAVITIIMAGMFMFSLHGQKTHMTESNRDDMFQNLRFIKHLLTEKLRSAGAGISQTNLPNINERLRNSYFLGVYPLNNANFPDGIILASADPNVYNQISEGGTFTPGAGQIEITSINGVGVHESTQTQNDSTSNIPEWRKNDLGMVVTNEGYYVFKVTENPNIGDNSLTIRPQPIYYSGLLNADHYRDNYHLLNDSGMTGNQIEYGFGSPIWKLDYFQIYLVVENSLDGSRTLTLTTDTMGQPNPLDPANASIETAVPIGQNIIDLQFEYIVSSETNFGQYEYWCSLASIDFHGESITSYNTPCQENPINVDTVCRSFYDLFKAGAIRSIVVSIAVRTDEMTFRQGKPKRYLKPVMGDSGDQTYHTKNYYRDIRFEVLLRNFCF